jgi:uncharacterized protein YaeQ
MGSMQCNVEFGYQLIQDIVVSIDHSSNATNLWDQQKSEQFDQFSNIRLVSK